MDFFRVSKSVKAWALPLAFAAGALFVVAGCGPYATNGAAVPAASPTPTAPPVPSSTPFTVASTQAIVASATATPIVVVQPSAAGISGSVTLPVTSVPPGTTITTTVSSSPPPGLPPFSLGRQAQAVRIADALPPGSTYVETVTLQSTTDLVGSADPVFVETLASTYPTTGVNYFLGILQNGAWAYGYAGPGTIVTVSGGIQVTLTGVYPVNLTANVPTYFVLYEQSTADTPATPPPSPTPSPTPTPTPTPAPTPTGAIGVGIH